MDRRFLSTVSKTNVVVVSLSLLFFSFGPVRLCCCNPESISFWISLYFNKSCDCFSDLEIL